MLHVKHKLWFIADAYESPEVALPALRDSTEVALYWYLKHTGGSIRPDIIKWSGVHERTVERKLKRLQDAGILYAR